MLFLIDVKKEQILIVDVKRENAHGLLMEILILILMVRQDIRIQYRQPAGTNHDTKTLNNRECRDSYPLATYKLFVRKSVKNKIFQTWNRKLGSVNRMAWNPTSLDGGYAGMVGY